jgi:hypothetical protein
MASGIRSLASDAAIWSLTNVFAYNAAINAREKCQRSGVMPDVTFLVLVRRVNNGIRHLVSGQQWQQTLGPLAKMQQTGVVPDVQFLELVTISACEKCHHFRRCHQSP